MILRVAALLLMAAGVCVSCDCREPNVKVKRAYAEIIFRGTIIEVKESRKPYGPPWDFAGRLGKTVVFSVSRVWKGTLGETFEMPALEETSACIGFERSYLNVGEDLLVYATRFRGSDFATSICGNHKLAKDAGNDFKVLGRGKEPTKSTLNPK
jgi:uncharacterized protein YihD (DUF1040 family)